MSTEKIGGQTAIYRSSEAMNEVEDESIDVVVTSPPYNRGKNYQSDDSKSHNDALPEDDYHGLLSRVFGECLRCLKRDGVFFLNIGDSATDQGKSEDVLQLAKKAGFHHLQTVIWVKSLLGRGHYTPSGGLRRLNNIWESVYVLVKHKKQYRYDTKAIGIPYADKSNIGRYSETDLRDAGNVWFIPYSKTTGKTVKKGHDAPFPVELARRCLNLVPDTKRVLDPFLGSGVTLAACEDLGLEGVGYELFPRRQLIRETIVGPCPQSRPDVLLPHLEKAVALLAKAVNESDTLPKTLEKLSGSRKGRGDRQILREVLEALKLAPDLCQRLESEEKDDSQSAAA
ncbi:MAG: site-specific DNA-methyltransferase [Planctomycetota bacterium]|nr:site-specific DNA-methyltransferase [Planctomycetota bacterium]